MYTYILQLILISCTILFFSIKLENGSKKYITIFLILFYSSIIAIIKLYTYNKTSYIFTHTNLFEWSIYDIISIVVIFIVFFLWTVEKKLKHRKNKEESKDNQKNKGKSPETKRKTLLYITLILFIYFSIPVISFFSIKLENKEDQHPNFYVECSDSFDSILAKEIITEINEQAQSKEIKEIFDEILSCGNIKLVNQFETSIYLNYSENILYSSYIRPQENNFWSTFNKPTYICFDYGDFTVLELEYSFYDGIAINDYYVMIIYGETISGELIVCTNMIVDRETLLPFSISAPLDGRKYKYNYEILKNDKME